MSRPYRRLSPLHDAAVGWVQKLKSGAATPEEVAAAARWRSQSPDHAAAFDAAEHVWREAGTAFRSMPGADGNLAGTLDAMGRRRRTMTRRRMLGGTAAAIAAGGVYGALDPPLELWPSLSELAADYRTGTGEQRHVTLADDIAINLNTQSSLTVRPATEAEDRVELIAGEASFATLARAARSLVVVAANGTTSTASGRFEVRHATAGERPSVRVTCLEGRIRIACGTETADLSPGQRVRYQAGGFGQMTIVDPVRASEWQRGIVEFRDTPLAEAVAEINRYRPGRIVLVNDGVGERQVNGRFRIEQMEKLLLQLELAFNLKLRRFPGGIVLLG